MIRPPQRSTADTEASGRTARRSADAAARVCVAHALVWALVWLLLSGGAPRVAAQEPFCSEGLGGSALEGDDPVHQHALGHTTLTYTVTAETDLRSVFVSLASWAWGYIRPETTAGWTTVAWDDDAEAAGVLWEDGVQAGTAKTYSLVLEGTWHAEPGAGVLRAEGCSPLRFSVPVAWNWIPAPPPPQPATVYGYTWEDRDRDGHWDEGEPPVQGHVTILRWITADPKEDDETTLVAVGDENGMFRFALEESGEVVLLQDAEGLWEATTPTSITVTVASGGDAGPYNFGKHRVAQSAPPEEPTPAESPSRPATPRPTEASTPPEVPEGSSLALLLSGISAVAAWVGIRKRRQT